MAHNYYQQQQQQQQQQYFKPQNIYDQLKNQDPQRVPVQLQHLLGQPQPTPSLVQQRILSFQQSAQHQPAHIPRPPTVYPQSGPLVPYRPQQHQHQQPGPLVPYHAPPAPKQYPYHQPVYTPAPPHPQTPLAHPAPPAPPPMQRRPLPPDPAKRSNSQPLPAVAPTSSHSPTRSRPLPPPTPAAPSRIQSNPQPTTTIQHPPSLRPRTPSPVKSNGNPPPPPQPSPTKVNINVNVEPPRRGRVSPPKFSAVPISASTFASSNTSSPSPGSSPSTSPTRESVLRNLLPTKPASSGSYSFTAPPITVPLPKSISDPTPSPPKPKPVWKKTLPDVLPPLLPTPPPNPVQQQQQRQHPHQQYNQPVSQPARPPPVPSHTRPAMQHKPAFVLRHPVTEDTKVTMWSKTRSAPNPPESEEEDEEEEGDDESQYTYEYYYSDEDEPIPKPIDPRIIPSSPQASPQYGIRDLPPRTASVFPHPGPLPQPPPMVRGNGVFPPPDSGFRSGQSTPSHSRPSSVNADLWDNGDPQKGQSMTMRFAAGANGNSTSSVSPSRPGTSHGGSPSGAKDRDMWPGNLPRLPKTPGNGESRGGGVVRFDAFNLDDESPPRSVFSMGQDGAGSPPSPQRRELPTPQPRAVPGGNQRQRPQSQIYSSSRAPEQQNSVQEKRRPQSQIYAEGQRSGYQQPLQIFARESQQQQQNGHANHLNRRPQTFSNPTRQEEYRQPESPTRHEEHHQPEIPIRQRQFNQSQSSTRHEDHHPQPQGPNTRQEYQKSQYQPRQQQNQGRHQRQHQQHRSRSPSPPLPHISASIIESPAPMGGRARLADIEKMESEGTASPANSPSMPTITIMDDDEPRRGSGSAPQINIEGLPTISVRGAEVEHGRRGSVPQINVSSVSGVVVGGGGRRGERGGGGPQINVFEVPGVSVSGPHDGPGGAGVHRAAHSQARPVNGNGNGTTQRRGGLVCGGCGGAIIGRIVNAMGQRWHPGCFSCAVCDELLEHVSSYEWGGKAYCHLDYHENFAPKCYHCKTPIIEERFISLDDPALGKRTYHEQHFFCAECGDPFLTPTIGEPGRTGELSVTCDGEYAASDDVGFTVYRGHPYCEACHVRLRMPKCKRCKRSIRDRNRAVEALGGKWCWKCFVCKGCERPFEDPSFFQRGDDPYCEECFSIILRNEI